jgi:hypothetical protein
LVHEQYRFSKDLSTEHAAYSLANSTVTAWNNKAHVGGIFCDLTKEFDCVIHNILIMKLQYYRLHEANINWLYLTCPFEDKEQIYISIKIKIIILPGR